ncbi:MAG: helix-turn-helix domain-containing protein [Anaerolineales bacterium]|nr:helix-turn-helix domain-containing protein [Anaerolineales bacterium]
MAEKHKSKKTRAAEAPTEQAEVEIQPAGSLLTPDERAILSQIAALGASHGQRALLLLALDEGASQSAAGEQAGISPRQVRYWRDRFLDQRLGIFPGELLSPVDQQPEAIAAEADEEPQSEAEAPQEETGATEKQAKDGKKKKKGKKKAAKKAKKTKKGKKSKKGKKAGKAKGKGRRK